MIGPTLRYASGAFVAIAACVALALGIGARAVTPAWERARLASLDASVEEAREALRAVDRADAEAVASLCRDDLWIDGWMQALAEGDADRERVFARQLAPRARALGFGTLAVLDAGRSAGGWRGVYPPRGLEPRTLQRELTAPRETPFVHAGGRGAPPHGFRVHACTGAREGVRLTVVGGRSLASDALPWSILGSRGEVHLYLTDRDGALPHGAPEVDARRRVAALLDAAGTTVAQWVAVLPHAEPPLTSLGGRDLALLVAATSLVSLLLGFVVARRLAAPLAALETAARRVAGGDLGTAVGESHGAPARRTTTAFNAMTEELARARARLRRAERIAAWRDIARQIAHEIKNPLSPIQVSIETMRKTYAKRHPDFDEIFEESTLTILEEVERLKRIVTEFSQFARMPRPRPEPLRLDELADHVVSLHRGGSVAVGMEIDRDRIPTPVRADREQITQVLVNLVKNGVEAARARHGDRGGTVLVRVASAPGGTAVEVEDDGPGIPEEARERVFEPYFTTKSEGTGLGLAIAFRIVEDHGGSLEVDASPSGGARFRVFLPTEGPPAEPETLTESPFVSRTSAPRGVPPGGEAP